MGGADEAYVQSRIKEFAQVFARELLPGAPDDVVAAAYGAALARLGSQQRSHAPEAYVLRFSHRCRFLGCLSRECSLCVNNPNKRCGDSENFDECYADNQVLRAKCDADISLELASAATGASVSGMGALEVQLSIVDGDSCGDSAGISEGARELIRSDEGSMLLGTQSSSVARDGYGRLILSLQDGGCRLPELFITDKTDTFHSCGQTFNCFRLLARAITRDLFGNAVAVEHVAPVLSDKFIVKTQRALNDYRKTEYPHCNDELTKLKFIGSVTSSRLRDIQLHIPEVPYESIQTVEQMKMLMLYADQHRQVEAKLLDLLNMKGKHKHKWDFLREALHSRIVYDDNSHRAWYADDPARTQGLIFACKQGQAALDKPLGVIQRAAPIAAAAAGTEAVAAQPAPSPARLQVAPLLDMAMASDTAKMWRAQAEEAWNRPGHPGWAVVTEQLELIHSPQQQQLQTRATQLLPAPPPIKVQDGDGADIGHRHSNVLSANSTPVGGSPGTRGIAGVSGASSPHLLNSVISNPSFRFGGTGSGPGTEAGSTSQSDSPHSIAGLGSPFAQAIASLTRVTLGGGAGPGDAGGQFASGRQASSSPGARMHSGDYGQEQQRGGGAARGAGSRQGRSPARGAGRRRPPLQPPPFGGAGLGSPDRGGPAGAAAQPPRSHVLDLASPLGSSGPPSPAPIRTNRPLAALDLGDLESPKLARSPKRANEPVPEGAPGAGPNSAGAMLLGGLQLGSGVPLAGPSSGGGKSSSRARSGPLPRLGEPAPSLDPAFDLMTFTKRARPSLDVMDTSAPMEPCSRSPPSLYHEGGTFLLHGKSRMSPGPDSGASQLQQAQSLGTATLNLHSGIRHPTSSSSALRLSNIDDFFASAAIPQAHQQPQVQASQPCSLSGFGSYDGAAAAQQQQHQQQLLSPHLSSSLAASMQQSLLLHDPANSGGGHAATATAAFPQGHAAAAAGAAADRRSPFRPPALSLDPAPAGPRSLKHCDSDSFRRALNDVAMLSPGRGSGGAAASFGHLLDAVASGQQPFVSPGLAELAAAESFKQMLEDTPEGGETPGDVSQFPTSASGAAAFRQQQQYQQHPYHGAGGFGNAHGSLEYEAAFPPAHLMGGNGTATGRLVAGEDEGTTEFAAFLDAFADPQGHVWQ